MQITHRVALMVPINKEKKILLQHRGKDAPIKPAYWGFFGGHIEKGEDAEAAVKREFLEELCIMAERQKFFKHCISKESINGRDELVERFFYTMPFDADEVMLKQQQQEGDDLGFFAYNDLTDLRIASGDREILREIFDRIDVLTA